VGVLALSGFTSKTSVEDDACLRPKARRVPARLLA
jgi:hypothetical protein